MKQFNSLIVLIIVVFFSLFIRVYNLGNLPVILNRDEAALAYNAYLLSETGQDEWGVSWPVTLESFGDYKLPGYPYFLAGFFKVLPENDLVTRLPSALAGTLLVVISYYLGQALFNDKKFSLFLAFLIAISPVFIFYSRIAFEANVALTMFVGALYLLLFKKHKVFFDVIATVLILLAIFTYNTPFILLPFIIPLIILQRGIKNWKNWYIAVIGLLVVFAISAFVFISLTGQKSGITIFSDENMWLASIAYRQSFAGVWQTLLGNKYIYYLTLIFTRFFNSFHPKFLVYKGDIHPWHGVDHWGNLYWSVYGLFILGLGVLLRQIFRVSELQRFIAMKPLNHETILLYLLIISLIPSIITVDAPHTTRSLLFLYLVVIFAVFGLRFLLKKLKKKRYILLASSCLLVSLEFLFFVRLYIKDYPGECQFELLGGYGELIKSVEQTYPDKKIAVVDGAGYQYILTSWYLKMTPDQFYSTVVKQLPDRIGFRYGEQIGRYHFIASPDDVSDDEGLLIMWRNNNWQVVER